uniref:GATA-type domain-containing protein n=1 Tax=Setaria digitata TaxID=48799 RepID=A0A915PH61_9BILA
MGCQMLCSFVPEHSFGYDELLTRGKCTIRLIKDIRTLRECDVQSLTDIFFSLVSFDPNNSRLASVQGEIRVGGSYQAKLPPMERCSAVDEPDRDELQWRPGYINEESEHVYKRATRSFRMFAMVRNEQITQMERDFRTGDLCMHDAIITLHKCDYNVNYAIEAMNKNDEHMLKVTNFMSIDDAKKFARGIKTYGKNFLKIKKELLPHHRRDELVQFYYGWKKTRDATRPKPLARQRNAAAATHRKTKNNQLKASRPGSTDLADYASASETEMEELENDGRAAAYACHHCYTSKSKDWHHSGKERQLLCTECRIFYKKYGQLRPVDRPSTVPPSLYKPRSPEGNDDEEQGVRTRANKKERRGASLEVDKKSVSSPNDGETKQRNGKRKRNHMQNTEYVNGTAKKRFLKGDKEDENTDIQEEDEPGVSSEAHAIENSVNTGKMNEIEAPADLESILASSKGVAVGEERHLQEQAETSLCKEKGVPDVELQTSISTSANAPANERLPAPGTAENEVAEAVEIATEQPSTSFVKPIDRTSSDEMKTEEEDSDDGYWTVSDAIAETTKNALLIRVIDRRCGQMCARTDLSFRMKPGSEWDKKREARAALKNHINNSQKKSNEFPTPITVPKLPSAQLAPLSGTPNVEAFMGGRVPMNGTAVSGLPGMFPGMPDPRFGFLTPQQQYAIAVEQQVFQKQMEQQLRAHQLEMMRNGANGTVTPGSTVAAVRDSPSRGGATATAVNSHGFPPNMLPPPFHNFGMDPRALAALMHNPQLASQFGMGIDSHTAAMMSALEQRNNLEQRMLSMAGMEMLAPGGIPVSQAPQSHLHPHTAAMMQHAAATHPGDALQLQQLLAMSAAAQAQVQRPFLEQNALLQMTMMNPFSSELGSRIVNPGSLNSDMMRRLQQEGGFAAAQRP